MINPYYLTARILNVAFTITLDSHHINHMKGKITIRPILFTKSEKWC